jgi:hypothetical protein
MNKKFKFIQTSTIVVDENVEKKNVIFYDEYDFKLIFESEVDNSVIFDDYDGPRLRSKPIIRSEIQESIKKQLNDKLKEIKLEKLDIRYVKMNKETHNRLRTFYSYEVSYVPKNLSIEDKRMGKIIGTLMGIKVVEDSSINGTRIVFLVKKEKTMTKQKFLGKSLRD